MLNAITLDSLSKAYDLDVHQCVYVAQHVSCWSDEGEPFSADKIKILGKAATLNSYSIESFPNRAIDKIRKAAAIWHNGEAMASINVAIQEYGKCIDSEEMDLGFSVLKNIVDTFFIDLGAFFVDKKQAVHLLDESGISLVQDVPGLTTADVEKILTDKVVAPSVPPAKAPDNTIKPSQQPAVDSGQEENQSDKIQHIQAWESILTKLTGAELTAARLAIEKWRGKSHLEAFEVVRPGEKVKDPKNYVSKMRKRVKNIALRYGLAIPPWSTTN